MRGAPLCLPNAEQTEALSPPKNVERRTLNAERRTLRPLDRVHLRDLNQLQEEFAGAARCQPELDDPSPATLCFFGSVNNAFENCILIQKALDFDFGLATVRIENQRDSQFVPGAKVVHFPGPDQTEHRPGQQRYPNSPWNISCP